MKNISTSLPTEKTAAHRDCRQYFKERKNIPFTNSKGQSIYLNLRRLSEDDLPLCLALQSTATARLDPHMFQPSSAAEYLDAMRFDYCFGLFEGSTLAAVCIGVINRKTAHKEGEDERNLCVYIDKKTEYERFFTFDTIIVHPAYRGFGIQAFFLRETQCIAQAAGIEYMLATVSPLNTYSKSAFEKAGYRIYSERAMDIYNSKRYLMVKELQRC